MPYLLLAIILGLLTLHIFTEKKHLSKTKWCVLTLFWLTGIFSYYTIDGIYPGDGSTHLARTWVYYDAIFTHGEIPIWTNKYYSGYPIGIYYGFLYYLISGLFSLLCGGNIFLTTTVFLITLHLTSGVIIYAVCNIIVQNDRASIIASSFYVLNFQHVGIITGKGALPVSIIYLLLPLAIWLFLLYKERRLTRFQSMVLIGWIGSMLILTHAQYGILALMALFIFLLFAELTDGMKTKIHWKKTKLIIPIVSSGVFIVALTSFFTFPLLFEKKYLMLNNDYAGYGFGLPFSLSKFSEIAPMFSGNESWTILYIGYLAFSISLFGCFEIQHSKDSKFLPLFCGLGLFYVAMNTRFINIWIPFFSILLCYGIRFLEKKSQLYHKILKRFALYLVFLLLIWDCLFSQLNIKGEGFHSFATNSSVPTRVHTLETNRKSLREDMSICESYYSTLMGPVPQVATHSYPFHVVLSAKAKKEFYRQSGILDPDTIDLLRLYNVATVYIPLIDQNINIPNSSPIWFSEKCTTVDLAFPTYQNETWQALRSKYESNDLDASFLKEINKIHHLSTHVPTLQSICLSKEAFDAIGSKALTSPPTNSPVQFEILEMSESHQTFRARCVSNKDGFVLLSYSWFPTNNITIDHREVTVVPTSLNMMAVPFPKGEHEILFSAQSSTLRKFLSLFCGILLISSIILFIKSLKYPTES